MVTNADFLNAGILVVDDLEANVRLLEQMLRGAGYLRVSSTRNPHEVCSMHRENHYDLILLDLRMPGMDGFQVMEGLKEIETDGYLPVLAVTAEPAHKLRALQSGAKDFVSKPLDLAEVLMRVHNMLEVRLLHEAARNYGKMLEELALNDPLTGLANRRHGGGVSGPGRLQGDQRHVGARRRRRSVENGCRAPGGNGARRRYRGACGW
jgi:PleD family two-component response regulator